MTNEYRPEPLRCDQVELDDDLLRLVERLAEHAHDVWAVQRLKDGWSFGPERCDAERRHPCLVPYSELPETEKTYDRNAVVGTIRAIVALGFRITRPEPPAAHRERVSRSERPAGDARQEGSG